MRKKRPPDHESVVEITKRYAAIEGKLRKVILEPSATSLAEHKKRIMEATKAAAASLAKVNKRFADSLSGAYKAGTQRAENATKKASQASQRRQDGTPHTNTQAATTGEKQAFKAVRRGAFIDLQNGMTGALAGLRKTVSETVRNLDDKNRNLWDFTRAIEGKLKDNGLLEVKYQNGAHIRLDHYAKMLARSSRIETENVGMFDAAERLGTDLVKCVGQSPTCELCATYRDRVYSVSGKDKRFPALRGGQDSPLRDGYHTIHPNCRCEFIPWFEDIEGPAETKRAIAFSNRPFKDSRTKKERDEYAAWQAGNRQLLTEQAEYDSMKTALGDGMPYKSLGGFRRARRDKSRNYLAVRAAYNVHRRHIIGLTNSGKSDTINVAIDELTPCLRDTKTGKLIDTDFAPASVDDTHNLKAAGWKFNWSKPLADQKEVMKLILKGDDNVQGLIAFQDVKSDQAIFVNLAEAAPGNIGKGGAYKGVGAHLFAIACMESQKRGYGGFVYFDAKTLLIDHYAKELGARLISGQRMYIDERAAARLIERYFKHE